MASKIGIQARLSTQKQPHLGDYLGISNLGSRTLPWLHFATLKIVLDSTVLRADYPLRRPASRAFLEGLRLVPAAQLCVPEVVVDEAENGFREELLKARERVARAAEELGRILGTEIAPAETASVDDLASAYRERLLETIASVGGKVLPYPKIDHKRLVQRDLQRRKPFDAGGKGYRDALIWETVRLLGVLGPERVVFVSNNTKDFGDGPSVHPDLHKDLMNPHRVKLVRSLAAVNEQLIVPKLAMLEGARTELEASRAGIFDLASWLRSRPMALLRHQSDDLAEIVAGFPPGVGRAFPMEIVDLRKLRVVHVRNLVGDEVLVRLEFYLEVDVSVSWTGEDVLRHQAVRDWSGDNADFSSASSSTAADFRMGVDLVVDRAKGQVESDELAFLEGDCGTIDLLEWDDDPIEPEPRVDEASAAPTTATVQP